MHAFQGANSSGIGGGGGEEYVDDWGKRVLVAVMHVNGGSRFFGSGFSSP